MDANANHLQQLMKMQKIIWPLAALSILSLGGCSAPQSENVVYASFYTLYDLTKRIAGDCMEVVNLTPAGSEPHDYTPTAKSVAGLINAKGLILNGLGLENWTENLPGEMQERTFVASEGIETSQIEGVVDPHVWLDVENAIKMMENITSFLSEIDPGNAGVYEENYVKSATDFEKLDEELSSIASEAKNKYLVTSHAAFGYLCEAYGFEQIYINGLSSEEEPTAKELEAIIDSVNKYGISTIFYEEAVSDAIAQKIADETGAKVDTLNPLETLTEDDLGAGKDYISVMRENMSKIKEAGQ